MNLRPTTQLNYNEESSSHITTQSLNKHKQHNNNKERGPEKCVGTSLQSDDSIIIFVCGT